MRRALAAVVVTVTLAVSPAAAQDADVLAAREQAVQASRERMEALYVQAAEQHARLCAFAGELEGRAPGEWPASWGESTRVAVAAWVERVRPGGASPDPAYDRLIPPRLLVLEECRLWRDALGRRAEVRVVREYEQGARPEPAVDLFCAALTDITSLPADRAWDVHLQGHPVVEGWRRANQELADARRLVAARAPTPLVALPKGRFEVGPWEGWIQDLSEKDNRRQKVSIGAIHVQQHEVTWAQYVDFLRAQPADERAALLPHDPLDSNDGEPLPPYGREDHPVTGVSFLQAAAYAEWLGMRLPTEDEWERCATDGEAERVYPWGPDAAGRTFASQGTGDGGTSPVTASPDDATPEGVRGLAGNVKELVATHPDRKPVKGTPAADEGVVIRGGGYGTRPDECTTHWRWFVEAGAQAPDVGFRCVIDDADLKRR